MIIVNPLLFEAPQPTWSDIDASLTEFPDRKLYALLDGARDESLLSRLEKQWPVEACLSIYAQLPEGKAPEVSPLLVPIDPQHNKLAANVFRRLLMPQLVKPESLLFLWSESPLEELAEHLGQYAVIETSAGKRALLRFHDPNIWPAALAVQIEAEQTHFFSCLSEVWRPDLDNLWWSYRCEPKETSDAFRAVQWDDARHQIFATLTEPRKILLRLEDEYETQIRGSRDAWLRAIRAWIDRADTFGATSSGDHYLYCVTALFTGDRFAETPEVAKELEAIGQHHAGFAEAIQAVPTAVWTRLENARSRP